MAQLLGVLKQRFVDSNGDPLAGGKLYSYEAGTSTPKNTFTDFGGLTANANPTILDSNGEADIWLDGDGYKFALYDSNDNLQFTVDNVYDIANLSVTTGKIANSAVTTAKINDAAVTTDKINDLAVTTAKIGTDAVTTAKILDANVTTAKIADNAITQAKRAALNLDAGADTDDGGTAGASQSTGSATATNTTAKKVQITSTGRPIFIGLQPYDNTSTGAYLQMAHNPSVSASLDLQGTVKLQRDGADIAVWAYQFKTASITANTLTYRLPVGQFWYIDTPSSGTYEYSIVITCPLSSDSYSVAVYNSQLVAYEL